MFKLIPILGSSFCKDFIIATHPCKMERDIYNVFGNAFYFSQNGNENFTSEKKFYAVAFQALWLLKNTVSLKRLICKTCLRKVQ